MQPPKCSTSISPSVQSRDAQSPSHASQFLGMFIEEVSHLRIILNFAVEKLVVSSLLHPPHSYQQW